MKLHKRLQRVEGEECAGWEEVANDTKEQVGKRLMPAEQPREGIGGRGSADDGLE